LRLSDTPAHLDFPGEFSRVRYGEGLFVGYRWYDARDLDVAFPFGHGLSYARFGYEKLSVTPDRVGTEGAVTICAEIVNEGALAAEEVVQLYVRDEVASVTRPVLELRGFARLSLAPGERRRLSFELHATQLAFHDAGMARVVEPGTIEVLLGASSADVRLRGCFEIVGERREIERPARFTTPARISPALGGSE
jgi:beta-glucosidase